MPKLIPHTESPANEYSAQNGAGKYHISDTIIHFITKLYQTAMHSRVLVQLA